jgi:hypothetical protein
LVEEYRTKKILSKETLGKYHRNFMHLSLYLIGKGRISNRERNQWYLQGFQLDIREHIAQRLAIVKSNVNLDNSYKYLDIHQSAIFILSCSTTDILNSYAYAKPTLLPSSTSSPTTTLTTSVVKTEYHDLDMLQQLQLQLANLTQLVTSATTSQSSTAPPITNAPTPGFPVTTDALHSGQAVTGSMNANCIFCGGPSSDHMARNCPIAEQYIRNGKCIRNNEACIILPSGEYIPRGIRGRWFCEQFDSYH